MWRLESSLEHIKKKLLGRLAGNRYAIHNLCFRFREGFANTFLVYAWFWTIQGNLFNNVLCCVWINLYGIFRCFLSLVLSKLLNIHAYFSNLAVHNLPRFLCFLLNKSLNSSARPTASLVVASRLKFSFKLTISLSNFSIKNKSMKIATTTKPQFNKKKTKAKQNNWIKIYAEMFVVSFSALTQLWRQWFIFIHVSFCFCFYTNLNSSNVFRSFFLLYIL